MKGIDFSSFAGLLLADGRPFQFKGVTWPGAETEHGLVFGLAQQKIEFFVDFVRAEGFNALRLPFAHRSVINNDHVPMESFHARLNADLMEPSRPDRPPAGVRYLDALLLITRAAAERHLVVVMAAQRLQADVPTSNLWYDDKLGVDEELVGQSWDRLAERLCDESNIVGVDLQHEPLLATWGAANAKTDWNRAAGRLGNRVLRSCPRWLTFVQGVHEGAPGQQVPTFFPGENLVNASAFPVRLLEPDKVVLTPHLYGPNTADFDYFHDADFPDNMPAIWQAHFLAVTLRAIELSGSEHLPLRRSRPRQARSLVELRREPTQAFRSSWESWEGACTEPIGCGRRRHSIFLRATRLASSTAS